MILSIRSFNHIIIKLIKKEVEIKVLEIYGLLNLDNLQIEVQGLQFAQV
jgi:hypothetical protein